jgi:anti-sigma regulatory factor (Ser/Thr protein kinase)
MQICIRNDIAEMAAVRNAIREFAAANQLNPEVLFALELCFEELVTNVILHGCKGDRFHSIEISLSMERETVVMQIKDDGIAFDPTRAQPPDLDVPPEHRRIGGLGIHLVRNYVDRMEYTRDGAFNLVTLKKQL